MMIKAPEFAPPSEWGWKKMMGARNYAYWSILPEATQVCRGNWYDGAARIAAKDDANARKPLCAALLWALAVEIVLTETMLFITPISWCKYCCYMVGDYFKGTEGALKSMLHHSAPSQCNNQIVTWLNPIESLWRASSECNIRFVPLSVVPLKLPQECGGWSCK